MATKPGDFVEGYGAESAREDAERIRDLCNQLHDLLGDIRDRIEATESVRNPVHDFDSPDLSDAPDVGAAIGSIGIIEAIADALEASADRLDEINDEAAGEANNPD